MPNDVIYFLHFNLITMRHLIIFCFIMLIMNCGKRAYINIALVDEAEVLPKEHDLLGSEFQHEKYKIRIIEPDSSIDYKILHLKPDEKHNYKMIIIDPLTKKEHQLSPEIKEMIDKSVKQSIKIPIE